MPTPLALSDSEITTVMAAARPLQPNARAAFIEAVAAALAGRELGDGIVARTCAELQKRFFDPPDLGTAKSKYR